METYVVDPKNKEQMLELETSYYLLFDEKWRCVEEFNSPPMDIIESGKYTGIVCKDNGEVVGCLAVDREGRILYPVMSRNYEEVLEAMCAAAYEHGGRVGVIADTDNELILTTAENFPGGQVVRTGTHLEWN